MGMEVAVELLKKERLKYAASFFLFLTVILKKEMSIIKCEIIIYYNSEQKINVFIYLKGANVL